LHSRFSKAINVVCGEHLLSLVDMSVGAGPLNIVLQDIGHLNGGRVFVGGDSLRIGETEYALPDTNRYSSSIEIPAGTTLAHFASGFASFRAALQEMAPPRSLLFLLEDRSKRVFVSDFERALTERFFDGCELLRQSRYLEGIREIKGLGWGLTPAGDDFIGGLLIALNLRWSLFGEDTSSLIEDVHRSACSDNLFSMAFLRCAKEGRIFETLQRALTAVCRADEVEISENTRRLVSFGETSGGDLAAGLIFGLENCHSLRDMSKHT
jgi:hypothetical protein